MTHGNWHRIRCLVVTTIAIGCGRAAAQDIDIDFDLDFNVVESDVQVLTRGPVHEAFAEPVSFEPAAAVIVSRAPVQPIEEIPPDQRPDAANVAWIPGYWAWDDERDDFLWVSGVWRVVPPGRQWVSGYWRGVAGGFQWVPGYWIDVEVSEVEYLPEPPEPVQEVVVNPPSPDYVWVPGIWVWQAGGYAWRPGYWAQLRTDWTWVPAHYVWSPRGYVFVDGYWDYVVVRRGVLFAPVYFPSAVVAHRVSFYSPRVAINLEIFTDHLFVRPHYHHYYFGDYYADRYTTVGFYPSFSFHLHHHGYDPIYVHRKWVHRHEPDWDTKVEASFRYRREHEQARPPRTLSAMVDLRSRRDEPEAKSLFLATSIDRMAKRTTSPVRFRQVDADEKRNIEERTKATRKSREERVEIEGKDTRLSSEKAVEKPQPVRAKVPKSPIMAKPVREADDDKSPPKKHVAPKPDPSVQPKPRKPKGEKAKSEKPKGKKDKDD